MPTAETTKSERVLFDTITFKTPKEPLPKLTLAPEGGESASGSCVRPAH
jgi:hypothetical protein